MEVLEKSEKAEIQTTATAHNNSGSSSSSSGGGVNRQDGQSAVRCGAGRGGTHKPFLPSRLSYPGVLRWFLSAASARDRALGVQVDPASRATRALPSCLRVQHPCYLLDPQGQEGLTCPKTSSHNKYNQKFESLSAVNPASV